MDSLHKSLYKQKPQLTLLETGRGRESMGAGGKEW